MVDERVSGGKSEFVTTYTPSLLETISRKEQRGSLGIVQEELPFRGIDLWNCYDFSWLGSRGKPLVSVAQLQVPASSGCMLESKSLKLYLGSFINTKFGSRTEVVNTLESDLTVAAQAPVSVTLGTPEAIVQTGLGVLTGQSIDWLDVEVDDYYWNPDFLELESDVTVRESLYSNLLLTLCPVTGQPDVASLHIEYNGRAMNHEGLLKYILSYRKHAEYAEQVVERMFVDLMNRCQPERLTVYAGYARRGGIDINPYRSTDENFGAEVRLWRQ